MPQVIVIGAGISGLAVAHALGAAGHEVIVFDEALAPGGRVHSQRMDGFLMEHGAAALALPAAAARGLLGELGLERQMLRQAAAARRRYLVRDGCVHALPGSLGRWLASDFFTVAGRMRLLGEPFVAARRDDETIAQFALRRFGPEVLDYAIDPLVGGLCAGDPRQLSVCAVFPQLKRFEREYGSVLTGAVAARMRRSAPAPGCPPPARGLHSFAQGMGTLVHALAAELSDRLLLGHRVDSVQRCAGGGFRVRVRCGDIEQSATADSVVIALPAYAAAHLLADVQDDLAQALAEIAHPPIAVVFLGYGPGTIAHPLDGPGVLMPAVEKRGVLGMLFSSALFSGRAPPQHVALTAYLGGAREPRLAGLAPDELGALVHQQACELLGARAAPVIARSRCWPRGLPQPGVGQEQRLARISAFEAATPGLFLTGNYLAGVSTTACIGQAIRTAARVRLALAPRRAADCEGPDACMPSSGSGWRGRESPNPRIFHAAHADEQH